MGIVGQKAIVSRKPLMVKVFAFEVFFSSVGNLNVLRGPLPSVCDLNIMSGFDEI
jgi:hypothetical protein